MAIKGLSIPVCGKYNYNQSTGEVSYTNGIIANKAIEYSAEFETADDNPLYADNGIAENDKGTFTGGTLTLSTADLPQDLSMLLLGLTQVTETVTIDGASVEVTRNVYDDNAKAPYLGFGIIELHQINDVDKYRAVMFNKVFFKLPSEAAQTKGQNIEWQTKSIDATINRSDFVKAATTSTPAEVHPWMEDAWFDTESEALAYLGYRLGYTAPTSGGKDAPPLV